MKVSAIVQVRMSSRRFPGKVLTPLNGKPMLQHLLDRLANSFELDQIIVATSTDQRDQAIEDYCMQQKIAVYRGPLDNVAQRFSEVIKHYNLECFVRISGDSPLIDPRLIDHAVRIYRDGDYDVVANRPRRTFPKGQSVEVLRAKVFLESYPKFKTADDFEHVTTYFYQHPSAFKMFNIEHRGSDYSMVNLSVDEPAHLEMAKKILDQMQKPELEYGWEDLIAFQNKIRSREI